MAYEYLHFMKKIEAKKNGHCALKLDMKKAYDKLEWTYLEAIMKKLGLSPRFVETVMRGVRFVTFLVLLNGGQTEEFKPSQGATGRPHIPVSLPTGSRGTIMFVETCDGHRVCWQ
jgi:hypothetical protein